MRLINHTLLRPFLFTLGQGLAPTSRICPTVRSQITRTVTFEISTDDGVVRQLHFNGQQPRMATVAGHSRSPAQVLRFASSGRALKVLQIEQRAETFPHRVTAYTALTVLIYMYPPDRAFAEQLYRLSMRLLDWSDSRRPVVQLVDYPLNHAAALFMARECGGSTTEARPPEFAETKCEPHFFGAENDRFAFGPTRIGLVVKATRS